MTATWLRRLVFAALLSAAGPALAQESSRQYLSGHGINDADKTVLWNYDVPKGSEVHTAVPIGTGHVLYVQNGPDPVLRVVNIADGSMTLEFPLPVKNRKSTHGQFRHARLTSAGTVMVAHMDLGKVCEYDATGKELWSVAAPGCWGVTPLPNGHVLITDPRGVQEVDRDRHTVWAVTPKDISAYKLASLQNAWRLPNGNTLLNNWCNEWTGPIDHAAAPVQAVEVTPDKHVAWALRAWTPPTDLGPATTVQVLDPAAPAERVTFGDVK